MLDPVEGAAVAEQFGGTALARSLVPDGRLSEDIDLLAIGRRCDVVGAVERQLVQGFGGNIQVCGGSRH